MVKPTSVEPAVVQVVASSAVTGTSVDGTDVPPEVVAPLQIIREGRETPALDPMEGTTVPKAVLVGAGGGEVESLRVDDI